MEQVKENVEKYRNQVIAVIQLLLCGLAVWGTFKPDKSAKKLRKLDAKNKKKSKKLDAKNKRKAKKLDAKNRLKAMKLKSKLKRKELKAKAKKA